MKRKPLFLVLMGPQGCGKGTQSEFLTDHFSIPSVTAGGLFREAIHKNNALGKKIKALVDQGGLLPDDLVHKVMKAALGRKAYLNGAIIDGYPRTPEQARLLDSIVKVSAAIIIQISDQVSVARLTNRLVCEKCGTNYNLRTRKPAVPGVCDRDGEKLVKRHDDTAPAIRARLKLYHETTEPVVDYYRKKKIAVAVDGEQPIVEVHEAIAAALEDELGIIKSSKVVR
ncbi:MAG: nucleoside monophosphate kinase [bacterium]